MDKKCIKVSHCKLMYIAAACLATMLVFSSFEMVSAETSQDGWCYDKENAALHITSDRGIERFFSTPNAPTEFGQIIFEEGVTTIEFLGRGIPSQPSVDVYARLISIPKTVTDIAVGCLYDQTGGTRASFQRIIVDTDNPKYYKENGMLIDRSAQVVLFADYDMEKAIVPNSVKTIGYCAFSNHALLQEVVLPDGIQAIGTFAFSECVSLSKINMPNSLKAIFDGAFSGCEQMNSLVFPPQVQFYLMQVSAAEAAASASLLDGNDELHTIVFTNRGDMG